jgi:predicted RNA-binding protein
MQGREGTTEIDLEKRQCGENDLVFGCKMKMSSENTKSIDGKNKYMTQYWLCILDRENWKIVKHEKVWGVADHHKNAISRTEMGDKLLFYGVLQKINGQQFKSTILGRAEVASGVFKDTRRIFRSDSVRKRNEIFPLRIRLLNLESFKEEIPFKPLIPELEFIKNKKKWGGHIQGSAMRTIPGRDFERIIRDNVSVES